MKLLLILLRELLIVVILLRELLMVVMLLGDLLLVRVVVLKVLSLSRVRLDVVEGAGSVVGVVLVVLGVKAVGSRYLIVGGVSVVEIVLTVARPVVGGGGGAGWFVPVVLDEGETGPGSQSPAEQLDAAHICQPGLRGGDQGQTLHQAGTGVGLGQAGHCEQGDLNVMMIIVINIRNYSLPQSST